MISRAYIVMTVFLSMIGSGCQMPGHQKQVRHVDPALPMTLNRDELVAYLNKQSQGLDGWRSTATRMVVRLPNGLTGRLKGAIACQAPQYFRLTASSVFAHADLGSNASRCWVYVKPGDAAVMTWKHEDTAMLQQVPTGVPYIDPNWLMLVLGITPLNAQDYKVSTPPGNGRELWLTAIEESPSGRPLRRVIKVDTVRGVIREHSVYDSEAHPLVRAILSDHCPCQGSLIPQVVKLQFPEMDSEMQLTFSGIETNPALPDELWRLPDHNVQVVDLGDVVRRKLGGAARPMPRFHEPTVAMRQPDFNDDSQFAGQRLSPNPFAARREASVPSEPRPESSNPFAQTASVDAPVWDDLPAQTSLPVRAASHEIPRPKFDAPAPPPRRRGFWPSLRR